MRTSVVALSAAAFAAAFALSSPSASIASDAQLDPNRMSLLNDEEAAQLAQRHPAVQGEEAERWDVPRVTDPKPLSVATLETTDSPTALIPTQADQRATVGGAQRPASRRSYRRKRPVATTRSWKDKVFKIQ